MTLWFASAFLLSFVAPAPLLARVPDDPFADQWAYRDTFVKDAWDITIGSAEVVVAVIDNGFDYLHPDISANVWVNRREAPDNGADDDKNGYVDDVFGWNFVSEDRNGDGKIDAGEEKGNNDPRPDVTGVIDSRNGDAEQTLHHGTLVAGLIGAVGDNGILGAGINWKVRLMNLKVVGNSGSQTTSRLTDAIRYAVDNGAHIINVSVVGPNDSDIREAVRYAYEHNVLVVAAAGNDYLSLNSAPRQPVCADTGRDEVWVIGVSGIGEDHRLAQFSNLGSDCIDITAPAVGIFSAMRYAPRYGLSALYGGNWKGTSFAAPFVSGAAALIKAIQPAWTPKEISTAIFSTVHKTPPSNEAEYANLFGRGLIRIDRALAYARDRLPKKEKSPPPLAFLSRRGAVRHAAERTDSSEADLPFVLPDGVNAFVPYQTGQTSGYVGIRSGKSGKDNEVVLFDREWRERRAFPVAIAGAVSAVFGYIGEESAPGIVVAPKGGSKIVFRAYDLFGREIGSATTRYPHRGVSLSLAPILSHHEVVAVYADANAKGRGVVRAHWFTPQFRPARAFDAPFVRNVGPVLARDFNRDGEVEIAIGGGAGDVPYLAYFDARGRELFRAFVFSPEYTGGLSLVAADYDGDGTDEVIAAPAGNAPKSWEEPPPAAVWRALSAERLAEWFPFGLSDRRGMSVAPLLE